VFDLKLPKDAELGTAEPTSEFETIIIGGGPAGLAAALYAARSGRKTVLLETAMPGGQAALTDSIENYPGFVDPINGSELAMRMSDQATRFGAEIVTAEVTDISLDGELKTLTTSGGVFKGRTVIIASGAKSAKLGVPGEAEYTGRGVSYCATCDGPLYRDVPVAVIGGGDSAVEEAMYLTRFASKTILVHRRDQLRATKVLQDRAFANEKMEFRLNCIVDAIEGDEFVKGLRLHDATTGTTDTVAVDGVFMFVGLQPNTAFLGNALQLDERGYIVTDENMRTNVPGVFAAGDVRAKRLRQVVTAVNVGAIAAVMADHYLSER
jgi:thioredoxin reductase (NADPH)